MRGLNKHGKNVEEWLESTIKHGLLTCMRHNYTC